MTIYILDDDGNNIKMPVNRVICPECDGTGRSSAHLGAFTAEDLDEAGPDFCHDYAAGAYDRNCTECKGNKVIEIIDQKRVPAHLKGALDNHLKNEAHEAVEQSMRARGIQF